MSLRTLLTRFVPVPGVQAATGLLARIPAQSVLARLPGSALLARIPGVGAQPGAAAASLPLRPVRAAPPGPESAPQQAPGIPASVRLHLQVPIRRYDAIQGWFGGMAHLPETLVWPRRNGRDQIFILQVNCALLPAGLWGGLGPRAGWLAVFVDPMTTEPTVLHFTDKGQPRVGPDIAGAKWYRPDDTELDTDRSTENPSAWPLLIRAIPAGEPDITPRHPLFSQDSNRPVAPLPDLDAPQNRPFDWATAIFALRTVGQMLRWHHARWKRDAPRYAADAPVIAAMLAQIKVEHDTLTALINAADTASEEVLFSPAIWDLLAQGLAGLRIPTARRLPEAEAATRQQAFEVTDPTPALTCMTSSFWQPYRQFLNIHAAQVYADDTHIPAPVLDYLMPQWSQTSSREPAGMGNIPKVRRCPLPGAASQVLFDLPSSDFLGWTWGIDLENLVITVPNADLAENRFDRITHCVAC